MYVKKLALLSAVAAAATFAATPASAKMSDMNWDLSVGNFYLGVEGGYVADQDVKSGHFDRVSNTVANDPQNLYHRSGGVTNLGARQSVGYRQMVDDMSGVSLEFGYGSYGGRELSKGDNFAGGSDGRHPTIRLDYTGMDLMLGAHYVVDGHLMSVSLGGQRTKVDLTQKDLADATAVVTQATTGTRFKAGVGYEYMVKDNVGAKVNYAHVFGDTVDEYQSFPGFNRVRNKANGVPSLDTLFVGLAMYF
ncbi:MAG: hypothetical protein CMF48_02460 [Legionellales bacterium]|nr:hypothetical protein [Legionellales bacterium]|tara:strand:- start:65 stop:811 length:747 start_codon:yes stop_codon:yes gene_type:complete